MKSQSFRGRWLAAGLGLVAGVMAASAADDAKPFLGRWALTIPGGGPGWLGITAEKGWYDASILWGGGSVVPVSSVWFNDGTLFVTRTHEVKRKDVSGKVVRVQQFTDLLTGQVWGDTIELKLSSPRENGRSKAEFIAKCGDSLRELEESAFWLELRVDGEIVPAAKLQPLRAECDELTAIFVTIIKRERES